LLVATPLHAQCADVSKLKPTCSAAECQMRQSKVHPTCDVSGGRTCDPSGPPLSKAVLQQRLQINQNCKAARQAVADCYKTPDSGHTQAISDAQNAINKCQEKLK
jgi:hypothetical protein